jgi:8-oxo-dGTP diphosphatase
MPKTQHDSETLAEGQQVITVCAFIHRENPDTGEIELFSPKRADTKKFLPGVYELPGGHVDFGEELIPALKREIKEEFSVEIEVGDCFDAFTYINEIKKSHSVEIVYFAQFKDPEKQIVLEPADHSEYKWFSKEKYLDLGVSDGDSEKRGILNGFDKLS